MPPITLAEDPCRALGNSRRIAFILTRGRVAYDYESPAAATSFAEECEQMAKNRATDNGVRAEASHAASDGVSDGISDGISDGVPSLPDEMWCVILAACGVSALCAAACTSTALARLVSSDALWCGLQSRLFGGSDRVAALEAEHSVDGIGGGDGGFIRGARGPSTSSEHTQQHAGQAARARCIRSAASLGRWQRGVAADPIELPLPAMTSVCLAGGKGVSTHDCRLTRLWEASSGRRIACFQHKSKGALTCCDASAELAAVGDSNGAIHIFDLEALDGAFMSKQTISLEMPSDQQQQQHSPCTSLLLLPTTSDHSRAICLMGNADGLLSTHAVGSLHRQTTPPPPHLHRHTAPLFLAASGAKGVYAASSELLLLYDLERLTVSWEADLLDSTEAVAHRLESSACLSSSRPADTHLTGRRPVSYSPGSGIVGTVCIDGSAALWDPRASPCVGPCCRIRLPSGQRGSSLHLDRGIEGGAWPGHALLTCTTPREGGLVHIFDIRHVHAGAVQSAGGGAVAPSLGATPKASTHSGAATCFAADGQRFVTGGGAKSSGACMWAASSASDVHGTPSSDGGSDRYAWRRRYAAEQEQAEIDVSDEPTATPRTKNRKARQTKKHWSH